MLSPDVVEPSPAVDVPDVVEVVVVLTVFVRLALHKHSRRITDKFYQDGFLLKAVIEQFFLQLVDPLEDFINGLIPAVFLEILVVPKSMQVRE